jgi:hypothetical protein
LLNSGDWYSKTNSLGVLAAYWVMPFRKRARVWVINKGETTVSGTCLLASGSWHWDSLSLYFHAAYQQLDHFMTVAQQGKDFTFLDLKGKRGVYAGDILQVQKDIGGWWGEGDEKIYVDGSQFPDDFGTGSEDYYGYSWGHPETFSRIFYGQPLGNANLSDRGGITVNTRKRDLDAMPFSTSFHFDMESWNWFGGPVNYRLACFWYEKPSVKPAINNHEK